MSNRILDYPEATAITSDDYILLDNAGTGAKCIKASALNINMDNYTIKEARGSIASFDDGEDLPLAFMGAYITAIQDLHGYDYPWVGGSGKNIALVDAETTQKPSYYDGSWSIGGLYGENGFITNKSNGDGGGGGFSLPIKNGSYVVSFEAEQGKATSDAYRIIMLGYDSAYSRIGDTISATASGNSGKYSFTVSLVEGTAFAVVRIVPNSWVSGVTHTAWINKIQIESGSTVTTWQPYSNECPIIGWSAVDVSVVGKNWLPTGRGYNLSYNADIGTVLDVDTDTADWIDDKNGEYEVTLSDWQRCGLLSNQLPIGATAYVRIKIVSGSPRVTTYTLDTDYRVIRKFSNYNPAGDGLDYNTQIQLAENEHYVGVAIVGSNKKVIIRTPHIVLNTDESYEPYNGQAITIQLGDTYYGCKLDVVSGVLTVDRVEVDLGDLIWDGSSGNFYSTALYGIAKTYPNGVPNKVIFEKYQSKPSKAGGFYPNEPNVISLNSNGYLYTASETTPTGQCVYELATPLTYQLTPQMIYSLIGENNIFADTGDSIVDYRKLWVKPEM